MNMKELALVFFLECTVPIEQKRTLFFLPKFSVSLCIPSFSDRRMRTETQERTEMESEREKRDERISVTDREKKPKKGWPPAQPRQVHATSLPISTQGPKCPSSRMRRYLHLSLYQGQCLVYEFRRLPSF